MGVFYSILAVLLGGLGLIIAIAVVCILTKFLVRTIKANIYKSRLLRERM